MNEKVLNEFKDKFNPFVDDEVSETESLEPGELKSPEPPEKFKPSPKISPKREIVKKPSPPPISKIPSPLMQSLNKDLIKKIGTTPIAGSSTHKYETMFHGPALIYKIAPDLPPAINAADLAELESVRKKAELESKNKEKASSSSKKAEKRPRSRSKERKNRRRSGSIIKGSGGFIRKGSFKLVPLDSVRGRGRNNRNARGGLSRHPSSRFRPATAQDRERGREEKKRRRHEIKSKDIKELPHVKWTKAVPSISYSFNPKFQVSVPENKDVKKDDSKKEDSKKDESKKKKEKDVKEKQDKKEKKDKKVNKEKKTKSSKKKDLKKSKKEKFEKLVKHEKIVQSKESIEPKESKDTKDLKESKELKELKEKEDPKELQEQKSEMEEVPTPSTTPPQKVVDLVDYDDDDDDEDLEIIESFPLSKDEVSKEESPNTEEYVDNWEDEEEKTPLNPADGEDSFKDGFSTPIFVNPSPPADHKFDEQATTQVIAIDSTTPPVPKEEESSYRNQDLVVTETKITKPKSSKVLFGIDDIYSDVVNSFNQSQTSVNIPKPESPSSSSTSSSSDSENEPDEVETPQKEEPENPYENFSEDDLVTIKKLDENLSKIQSMRVNYGDPLAADEFCEGLKKMEKYLTTQRNIIIKKYLSTPQFLVTLQEAEVKENHSPTVFQSSIKMVISPTKISKNRIQSNSNLLGSDDDEEAYVNAEESSVKVEEPKKEEIVIKEEKKSEVVEVKKERRTKSPEKKEKDRKSSKGKSDSPSRKRRSRSPKIVDKHKKEKDRHVSDERHKRRSKSRSVSPRRRSHHHRRSARSRSRSFSPRNKRRRSRSRSRGYSRSPLPFKPPSPPPIPTPPPRSSSSASPKPPTAPKSTVVSGAYYEATYNDINMASYNSYGYGYMTQMPQTLYPSYFAEQNLAESTDVNVCDFGLQSHLNQNPSVIKELPKATTPPPQKSEIAVQKGNVLEIVPKEPVPMDIVEEPKPVEEKVEQPVKIEKLKAISFTEKRKEVEFRYINTAVLRLRKENEDPSHGILKKSRSSSDEETPRPNSKSKKKSVLFEDGIKPTEDSEEEDRRDIEQKIQRKLKRLKKKYDQLEKENMEQQIKKSASDDEWDKMTPPPPPSGSPPPHLEQPIYLRPDSPPVFTYFLYDSVMNALYTARDPNALPPRLLFPKENIQTNLQSPVSTPPIGSTPPPPMQKPLNGKPPPPGSFSPNLSQPPPNFFIKMEQNSSSPLPFAGSPPLPFIPPHMQKNPRFPNTPPHPMHPHPQFFPRMQFPPHLQPPPFNKPPQMGPIPMHFGAMPMGMPQFCAFSPPPPPPHDMIFHHQHPPQHPHAQHFQQHMPGYPMPPGHMGGSHIMPHPPKKKGRFN